MQVVPEQAVIITLIAATIAVAIVAVVLLTRADRRRDAAFRTAARRLGWNEHAGELASPARVSSLRLFTLGRSRKAANVFTGRPGRYDATLFDYRYTVGSGRNSRVVRQTVMVVELPDADLPAFELRPENLFHKIGAAFGMQDIDLDNRPEFSKAYLLRGEDEAAVRRTFEMGVARHFERTPGWSVDGRDRWIVVYRSGKRVKPEDLADFVRNADHIASVLADH